MKRHNEFSDEEDSELTERTDKDGTRKKIRLIAVAVILLLLLLIGGTVTAVVAKNNREERDRLLLIEQLKGISEIKVTWSGASGLIGANSDQLSDYKNFKLRLWFNDGEIRDLNGKGFEIVYNESENKLMITVDRESIEIDLGDVKDGSQDDIELKEPDKDDTIFPDLDGDVLYEDGSDGDGSDAKDKGDGTGDKDGNGDETGNGSGNGDETGNGDVNGNRNGNDGIKVVVSSGWNGSLPAKGKGEDGFWYVFKGTVTDCPNT